MRSTEEMISEGYEHILYSEGFGRCFTFRLCGCDFITLREAENEYRLSMEDRKGYEYFIATVVPEGVE